MISCDKKQSRFIGHQRNGALRVGALGAHNTRQLPVFDKGELETYLLKAYEHSRISIGSSQGRGHSMKYIGDYFSLYYSLVSNRVKNIENYGSRPGLGPHS